MNAHAGSGPTTAVAVSSFRIALQSLMPEKSLSTIDQPVTYENRLPSINVRKHIEAVLRLSKQKIKTIQVNINLPICLFALGLASTSGCTTVQPVAAYDRGHLSEDGMAWDSDKRNAKLEGHVYTSKEASSGGAGAAGGGCGCN